MSIKEDIDLKEMFLVRNVLIHNNKIVGTELANGIKNSKYVIGKKVSVSENDLKRFKSAIRSITVQINKEYLKKTTK